MNASSAPQSETISRQFCTFMVADRLYGIDVMKIQEVTKALPKTSIPLAPNFVHGLINLRGQISTAIGLRELFEIGGTAHQDSMNEICRIKDVLVSFVVDQIGDVVELAAKDFEPAPETIPEEVRRFVEGVYKIPGALVSILNVEKLGEFFFNSTDNFAEPRHAIKASEPSISN